MHSGLIGQFKTIANEWVNGGPLNTNYTSRLSAGIGASNWNVTSFVAGTGCVASNANQLAFFGTGLTGTGNVVYAIGFNDSATIGGGNLDWFADFPATASVPPGMIVQFNVGNIQMTLL